MSAFSISPYSSLRFVGTDMGTLFRSEDGGHHWEAVAHDQTHFDSELSHAASLGFSANPLVIFHAPGGIAPVRSTDGGRTWNPIPLPLLSDELIKYWISDRTHANVMFAASTRGLLKTTDTGNTWKRVADFQAVSVGSFYFNEGDLPLLYHATPDKIYVSKDQGESFEPWHTPVNTKIRSFAGGKDAKGLTLAWIDTDGAGACSWVKHAEDVSETEQIKTMSDCGYVWIKNGASPLNPNFVSTKKDAGRFVRMAENDSQTLYITGGEWMRMYGSKVWVSRDAGKNWKLQLHLYDEDMTPFQPWPAQKLEYSGVALDVGWDDNEYTSFVVNPLNSSEAGGTGFYFLHTTQNFGETWQAPFTQFADQGDRSAGKRWRSTGLEVTSVMKLKFHPGNSKLGYASLADIGGLVTEDGGNSWRISKTLYNTNYDYAFDPSQPDLVYAAMGSVHDYPLGNTVNSGHFGGGVFRSENRGKTWQLLTPSGDPWKQQFLTIAFDPIHRVLFAGGQGCGVARSRDQGKTWEWMNEGLPGSSPIISSLKIDPKNGDVYALLAGDPPDFPNPKATGIYFLNVSAAHPKWKLLRGTVRTPQEITDSEAPFQAWLFPTAFEVDWSRPKRDVLWLADLESKAQWLSSGVWKSTDRGGSWIRSLQFTHPAQLVIDPHSPDTVYASGLHQVDGAWGQGGAMVTTDGGNTWKKNEQLQLKSNLLGVTLDPNQKNGIFYLFFGGGMLYGPRPK